ncbi:hypothetical protein AURDEDRAFT_159401 [Auricularia subglabra TFB-10046 SS5]|nr:hypothetical protein AURDEDRAFT_159401 [Auricularia subglabra TFB-10046 SS5]
MAATDPIHNNPSKIHATAHTFAQLLDVAAEGHPLWHPTKDGRVGDCGSIAGGTFQKVFNVYDFAPGRPQPLPRPSTDQYSDIRVDENLHPLCSSLLQSVNLDGSAELAPHASPAKMTFKLNLSVEESSVAYLRFRGEGRVTEVLGIQKRFELQSYIKQHATDIRNCFPPGTEIVFVYGVTRAAGWLSAVAHRSAAQVGLSAPSAKSNLLGFSRKKKTRTESIELPTTLISAKAPPPSSDGAKAVPPYDDRDHCIVLKLLRLKPRLFDSRSRSLPVPEPEDANSQASAVLQHTRRASLTADPQRQSPPTSHRTSSLRVECKAAAAARAGDRQGTDDLEWEDSASDEAGGPEVDGPGIAETAGTDGQDLLSILLGRILAANADLGAVIGSWADIEAFRAHHGELPRGDTAFAADLSVDESNKTAYVVRIERIDA